MSALAAFIRLPASAVDQLPTDYDHVLVRHGQSVADYKWSGFVLATLLPYLDEQGIKLMRSPFTELTNRMCQTRGETIFIFTPAHRDAYLDRLSPSLFSANELRDYFNRFNATNEPEIGRPMLDGISAFRQSLAALDADSVILFSIA